MGTQLTKFRIKLSMGETKTGLQSFHVYASSVESAVILQTDGCKDNDSRIMTRLMGI